MRVVNGLPNRSGLTAICVYVEVHDGEHNNLAVEAPPPHAQAVIELHAGTSGRTGYTLWFDRSGARPTHLHLAGTRTFPSKHAHRCD